VLAGKLKEKKTGIFFFFGILEVTEERSWIRSSVADPECLSPILIFTHCGTRISDPGSKNSNKRLREG
jgi:hypothetical protein